MNNYQADDENSQVTKKNPLSWLGEIFKIGCSMYLFAGFIVILFNLGNLGILIGGLLVFAVIIGLTIWFAVNRIFDLSMDKGKTKEILKLIPLRKIKENFADRCLYREYIKEGFYIYERIGKHKKIYHYIYHDLPIPEKFVGLNRERSEMANLPCILADNLFKLKDSSISLKNPYVDNDLKSTIKIGLEEGFSELWSICHRLALIEKHKLLTENETLEEVRRELRGHIEISNQAQRTMSNLILERDPYKMEEYKKAFSDFTESAKELRAARKSLKY